MEGKAVDDHTLEYCQGLHKHSQGPQKHLRPQSRLSLDFFTVHFSGTLEERGLLAWSQVHEDSEETQKASKVYALPWGIGTKFCTSSCAQILPFWPRIDHHRDEVGASQLTLCSQTSGKHLWTVSETKM